MNKLALTPLFFLILLIISTQLQAQLTTDPYLNKLMDVSSTIMTRADPNNQQFKDQQWNPPTGLNAQEMGANLFQICVNQAEQMNVYDTNKYCTAIGQDCQDKQMDFIECYRCIHRSDRD